MDPIYEDHDSTNSKKPAVRINGGSSIPAYDVTGRMGGASILVTKRLHARFNE